MNEKTKEHNDQADELRKLFNEVQEESLQSAPINKSEDENEGSETKQHERGVDILDLPPRSQVHSTNNKRTRLKLSNASQRLIVVVLIFLAFLGGAFYLWGQELMKAIINI